MISSNRYPVSSYCSRLNISFLDEVLAHAEREMLLNRVLESNEAEPAEAARLPIYVCALPTRYARNLVGPREPEWRDHHFFPPHPGLENRELFLAFNAQDAMQTTGTLPFFTVYHIASLRFLAAADCCCRRFFAETSVCQF